MAEAKESAEHKDVARLLAGCEAQHRGHALVLQFETPAAAAEAHTAWKRLEQVYLIHRMAELRGARGAV